MEVEAFQPLVYALDGYIAPFAVILWILLPELIKCNQLYKCKAKKYTPKKMIDSILAIVIYRSRENLAHAIFYQGKLSERTGRKATGLKERCRCSVTLFSTKFFALSKPGCRDGYPVTRITHIWAVRLFHFINIKSTTEKIGQSFQQ